MATDDSAGITPGHRAEGASKAEEGLSRLTGVAANTAAWAFAFLILRIFAVSGYNWDTAFLVSTTLGLDDGLALVVGSLMATHLLVALLLVCVLPLVLAAYLWGPRQHRPVAVLMGTLGAVMLTALTVSFNSWWLPAAAAAVFGMLALIRLAPVPRALRRISTVAVAKVGWVAGVGVLIVAAFVGTPWVPHEQIVTTDGTISGYVLSVDSGYLNVLTDEQEFRIVISSDVLSRD